MENASDALLIGGSIIIACIIISALVFVFNEISNFEKTDGEVSTEEKINDFNKSYTTFEKDLYGSELLSLINKAVDYNEKNTREGFLPIKIKFEVKRSTGMNRINSLNLVGVGTYLVDSKTSNPVANNLLVEIEKIKSKYKGDKYLQRLVSLQNSGKESEIAELLEDINIDYNSSEKTVINKEISKYSEYMEFKRKKFKFDKTTFDGEQPGYTKSATNGRIIEMSFIEIIN